MTARKWHEIWLQQYEAAQGIKRRYGLKAAFDYLVAEKLLNFVEAAETQREFAWKLPRFVSQVRLMFTPFELSNHIARIERELHAKSLLLEEDDDLTKETPTTITKRAAQFATIKELLTATELGTS
jgi:hypothetical protein